MTQSSHPPLWIGVAIAFYAFIAIGLTEANGVLIPSILSAYHLTPATVSLLFVTQITGYVIAALSSSLVSSRLGLARMLLLAALCLTGALLAYALVPFWSAMVTVGIGLGLGIGLIDAGINTYIVNSPRTAHLIGVLHAFYGMGAFLGPTIATTLLALEFTWRQVYLVNSSIVGLLLVGLLWVIACRYPLTTGQVAPADAQSNLRMALKTPVVLVTGVMLMVYVGTEVSIGSWAYTVQHLSRNIPALTAGYSVAAYWIGLTIGRLCLGYMMSRLGAVRTIDGSLLLLVVGLLVWWLAPSQEWSLPLMGLALATIFPATIALIPQRVPVALVPATVGFVTSFASLGAAVFPSVTGWLATHTGLASIPVLMLPLVSVLVVLHRWLVRHSLKQGKRY